MNTYCGAVSSHAANSLVRTATGDSLLFDFLVQQAGYPHFWGRSIPGKDPQYLLTLDEARFSCNSTGGGSRMLVVHSGLTPGGDYQMGPNDALNAVEAAQNLGVPLGITLYRDIEVSMLVSPGWPLLGGRQ